MFVFFFLLSMGSLKHFYSFSVLLLMDTLLMPEGEAMVLISSPELVPSLVSLRLESVLLKRIMSGLTSLAPPPENLELTTPTPSIRSTSGSLGDVGLMVGILGLLSVSAVEGAFLGGLLDEAASRLLIDLPLLLMSICRTRLPLLPLLLLLLLLLLLPPTSFILCPDTDNIEPETEVVESPCLELGRLGGVFARCSLDKGD